MTALAALIDTQLTFLDAKERTYVEKIRAVGTMLSAVEDALASPALSDATKPALDRHTARAALESLRATIYRIRDQQLGANVHPRVYVVPSDQPLWMVAKTLFKDARRWPELLQGNSIRTPHLVRAGTSLVVLAK
jgi:prophage DNA circulation protein